MESIEVKKVSFGYSGTADIIKDVSLSIKKGDFLCIIGENGSREKYIDQMYSRIKQRISRENYYKWKSRIPTANDRNTK